MSDAKFESTDLQVQHVQVRSNDTLGLYLGDLRKLVELAEDLPDDAVVTRTPRESESVRYAGEFYLFGLHIRNEVRT